MTEEIARAFSGKSAKAGFPAFYRHFPSLLIFGSILEFFQFLTITAHFDIMAGICWDFRQSGNLEHRYNPQVASANSQKTFYVPPVNIKTAALNNQNHRWKEILDIGERSAQPRFFLFCRWAGIFLIIELLAFYVGWKSEHTAQTMQHSESQEYQHLLSLSQHSRQIRP